MKNYWQSTRSATYGFLGALPLLIMYQFSVLVVNRGAPAQVRVGAEVWIRQAMAWMGATGMFAVGIGVLAIGIAVFVADRKHEIPIRPGWMAAMVGESFVYAVLTALFVAGLVGAVFGFWPLGSALHAQAAGPQSALDTPTMLALSIGAGLYEELVFRVLLVGGLYLGFRKLFDGQVQAYLAAALIGAFLFSAVHYVGPYADALTVSSFSFRFLFGLVLNAIFLLRGFAVAAWTHSLYDVLVVTHFLG